ncbi:MAG: putative ABC transporter permease [Oscillospiraceae bacterium]|nr:putative ABC transporter permease [Oscillospiraceae bacterium]
MHFFFETLPVIGYSPYQLCIMFVFWGFIGWIVDVLGVALEDGRYSNRGFLSMPVCPIYGFGVIIVTVVLRPVFDRPLLLFALSLVICTALEYTVGVLMKLIFHNVWWDYTHIRFNFQGLICLRSSLFWGFGCVLVEKVMQPGLERLMDIVPVWAGVTFICIMAVLIIIDTANSVAAAIKLDLRLKEISEISRLMYDSSQVIGKTVADSVLSVRGKGYDAAAAIGEKTTETYERIRNRYDALIAFSDSNMIRLIKAFPHMRSFNYPAALEAVREHILRSSGGSEEKSEPSEDNE